MGRLMEHIDPAPETVAAIMGQLNEQSVPMLVKLRGLWLLEKVARQSVVDPKEMFEPLTQFFIETPDFVQKFQALKTAHAYMRRLNLKESYPDTHFQIVSNLLKGVVGLIGDCNNDTVAIPIATIRYLVRIDEDMAKSISGEVSQIGVDLYGKFFAD